MAARGDVKIRLEYGDCQTLAKCLVDRARRLLFYPAVGRMELGQELDADIAIYQLKVQVPLRLLVVGRRTLPQGARLPRGTYLEVVPGDAARYERLCQIADGVWLPESGRAFPRVRAELKAQYYVPPSFFEGYVFDVSPEGLFLRTEGPLVEVGKGVLVRVNTGIFRPRLELETKVCWIDRMESRRGMGLFCFGPAKEMRRLVQLSNRFLEKVSLPPDFGERPSAPPPRGEVGEKK